MADQRLACLAVPGAAAPPTAASSVAALLPHSPHSACIPRSPFPLSSDSLGFFPLFLGVHTSDDAASLLSRCKIVANLHQVDPFQHKLQERSEIEPKKTKVNFGVVDNLVTDVPLVLSSSRLEGNSAPPPPPPPLVSALKAAAEQNVVSFHFPGHNRGRAAPSSLAGVIGIDPFVMICLSFLSWTTSSLQRAPS
ncbi:hypothetical protein NL676_035031 [Syzygium grande]|nr:hypothetical protein NL676_035031 [Syzygium grande]